MKTIHLIYTVFFTLVILTGSRQVAAQNFTNYAEHSIWQDSYPIFDAVNYKGSFFALQNHPDKLRLIKFDIDPKNGIMQETSASKKYWEIAKSAYEWKEADAEVVEYRGELYIYGKSDFTNYNHSSLRYDYKFSLDGNNNGTVTDLSTPFFLHNCYPSIAATVYKNALCLFYIDRNDEKVRMAYTKDDPANKDAKWVIRETISQVIHNQTMLNYDTWDVCTWYGESNGKQTQKLVLGLIAGRNMWAYTFDGELENSNNSTWTSTSYGDGAPEFGSFSLKLLQGAITGVGSDIQSDAPDNNPVQFIYALRQNIVTGNIHQRQILTNEYFPSKNTFGTRDKYGLSTNLPYGYFGAAIVSSPYESRTVSTDSKLGSLTTISHQQYICIFRGSCDGHFNQDSHYALIKSNMAKVSYCTVPTDEMLTNPTLRKLCSLDAVVEGAPPAVVDNNAMYKELPSAISSLRLSKENTKLVTEEHTNNISVDAGLGPDTDNFTIQALGGYELSESTEESKTITTTYGTTYSSADTISAATGFYIYTIPELRRYTSTFFSPNGIKQIKGRPVLIYFLQKGVIQKEKDYRLNDPSISKEIRVDSPWQLESWYKRQQYTGNLPDNTWMFNTSVNPAASKDEALSVSKQNKNSRNETIKFGENIKTPAFQITNNYSFTMNKSTSTTLSQGISMNINALQGIDLSHFNRKYKVDNYELRCYFLNNPADKFTATYYADLKRRKVMIEGEKPYILAWEVVNIDFGELLKNAIATSDETITPEGARIYNDGDALAIQSAPASQVQVYSIGGRIEASQLSPDGLIRIPLAKGVYIIRIQSGKNTKVYKAMKQ